MLFQWCLEAQGSFLAMFSPAMLSISLVLDLSMQRMWAALWTPSPILLFIAYFPLPFPCYCDGTCLWDTKGCIFNCGSRKPSSAAVSHSELQYWSIPRSPQMVDYWVKEIQYEKGRKGFINKVLGQVKECRSQPNSFIWSKLKQFQQQSNILA